jgi:aspartate kinase
MLSVLKIGGSVLRDAPSYRATARFLQARLAHQGAEKLVVIVSAQYGQTDALLEEAHAIVNGESSDQRSESQSPTDINSAALDLLWCTGELRSVALLTLHLQTLGVDATPFNVHQTGLVSCPDRPGTTVRPLRLLAALASSRIVVVPGFLGVSPGGTITSLGRGGSDLTAVLLAAAIRADACELIKDVPGYFTADPHRDAGARPIHDLAIAEALAMADAGCDLVQRAALVAAAAADLHIVIRSMDAAARVTHLRSQSHGIRYQDDSRRAAVGA